MKKIFLCFLFLFPAQLFAQEDLTQGIFKGMLEDEIAADFSSAKSFDPHFSGGLVADLNYDRNYQSTNSNNEFNDSLLKNIFASKFSFNKNFSISSVIRLDEVSKNNSSFATNSSGGNVPASAGSNRYFQEEALRVEEITANYNNKNVTFLAGKFVPNFGMNWKWGRGIWSNNLSNNYKQTQKIGAGVVYKMGDRKKTGQYNFGFTTFTNDRTGLNNSAFSQSESYNKNAGAPADVYGVAKSYDAAMDVLFDFGEKEKLTYHFSYLNLAVNSNATPVSAGQIADQKGYAAAMNYRYPVSENFLIDSLFEYVRMKNVGGNADIGDKYSAASLVGEIYHNWNITAATTNLARNYYGQGGFDQNLSEISFGYKFNKTIFFDNLSVQLGYKNFRTNYKTSVETNNSMGALLRYTKAF